MHWGVMYIFQDIHISRYHKKKSYTKIEKKMYSFAFFSYNTVQVFVLIKWTSRL